MVRGEHKDIMCVLSVSAMPTRQVVNSPNYEGHVPSLDQVLGSASCKGQNTGEGLPERQLQGRGLSGVLPGAIISGPNNGLPGCGLVCLFCGHKDRR